MKLLVDLGNSRLKWALWDGRALQSGAAVDHAQPLRPQLDRAWADLPPVDAVLVASVARDALETELTEAIVAHSRRRPDFVRSRAALAGVRSAYAQPEKLGVDRFLALVALHVAGTGNCVHVGVGTALTLDALAANGEHLGGLIAPSPALMQQALLGATARVTAAADAPVQEIAQDTEAAVQSGCWLAAVALVERFHAQAAARFGAAPALVVSGGAAARLCELLDRPAIRAEDLVLRGLAAIATTPA